MFRSTAMAAMAVAVLWTAPLATPEAHAESVGMASKVSLHASEQTRTVRTSRSARKSTVTRKTAVIGKAVENRQPAAATKATVTRKAAVTTTAAVAKSSAGSSKPARKSKAAGHGGKPSIVAAVKSHARAAGVPVSVALAVVKQESSFNPKARGAAGEIGLMQLKCQTARGMGFKAACSKLYHVPTNLRYGMRYLKKALNRGSVAYFNAGIHAKTLPAGAKKYARQVAAKRVAAN